MRSILAFGAILGGIGLAHAKPPLPWIAISKEQPVFIDSDTQQPFIPWGFNYDHDATGRLIEDYWEVEWDAVVRHFRQMKALGANTVRIHLQLGRFMETAEKPHGPALRRLEHLLRLAEDVGLYLDVTGLGCYHQADVPPWYDRLSERERWDVQARFWEAVARVCAPSPAVFCYDLMNEPVVPAGKRPDGSWLGPPLANKHFVQLIALDQAQRPRPALARQWIDHLCRAIRRHDPKHLITVGLVDWSLDRPGLTSGFVPKEIHEPLDFLCVHLYPKTNQISQAIETLQGFNIGKPVLIEETFPLECTLQEFDAFVEQSRRFAAGWLGFYWGKPPDDLRQSRQMADAIMLKWLDYFEKKSRSFLPPIEFEFKQGCGPSPNSPWLFDPREQTYHIGFKGIARLMIRSVADDLSQHRLVLRISGMLDSPEGPLTLYPSDPTGKAESFSLDDRNYDKERFRIERKDGITTIEFLPKGKELLRAGAWFQYVDYYRK